MKLPPVPPLTLGSVVLGQPPAKEPTKPTGRRYNSVEEYMAAEGVPEAIVKKVEEFFAAQKPATTVWKLTKDSLPPIRQLVLTSRKEGGLNIAYLMQTSGGKVLWHMSNGKLPVDGIRAWAEIPKVDV